MSKKEEIEILKNLKEYMQKSIKIALIVIIAGTLIFWGLGNLVIWVFKINYVWTIWHGLICEIGYMLLKEIFGSKKE